MARRKCTLCGGKNRIVHFLRPETIGKVVIRRGEGRKTVTATTTPTQTTEAALVIRAQDGDREAFAQLYTQHGPAVQRLALARLPAASADDATAETFVRAWKSLPRYRDKGVPFVAWLYGIARNVIADTHRAAARTQPAAEMGDAVDVDPTDGEVLRLDLEAAISKLPKRQRQVIELKYLAGLTNDEVGAALGKSPGAINTLQWRALQALRQILEEEDS